jgi:hypothetical protein
MKYIITDFFEKQFSKVVKDISLDQMIHQIHLESKSSIQFKEPYIKVKMRTETKSYRIVLLYDKKEGNILFINIFDKKDKVYGENLTWDLHKNDILFWTKKNAKCIE